MSLRTGTCALLVAALSSLVAGVSSARDFLEDPGEAALPIEITADRIVYEQRRQVYVAEGSVHVVQGDRRIDADWIVFNRETRRGIAAGNVRAVDEDAVLEARFIEFDDAAQQGLVLTGRLDLGEDDFRVAAGELVKVGSDRYEASDLSMTTCRCPDDDDRLPWVINANEASVEIGGYAMVTNSTVDVLGVPALWLPWAAFPVKTDRATGLLPPELRYGGGNGFEVALPFFWAAQEQVNVILTPRYMTTRGFKPELLVETVYGRKSSSELFASYLHDQDPDQIKFDDGTGTQTVNQYHRDRFGVGFDNDVYAPLGIRLRSDIQIISDNEYVRDFQEFEDHRKDRFVESVAFGFRQFGADGSAAGVVSAVYRNDRQNPDRGRQGRLDRDRYLLHRAGNADLAWLPTRIEQALGVELGFGFEYTNFYSYEKASNALDLSDPADGTVQGDDRYVDIGIASIPGIIPDTDVADRARFGVDDQVFQEGEPLNDEGHRFVLTPHLGHSFRLFDLLDVRPEVGWHQTLYTTEAQSFEDRGFLTGRVDVQTQLMGNTTLSSGARLVHLMEPRVGWAYVEKTSQSSNPLFVPATRVPQRRLRQLSLDNLVLDDADRIDPANVVSLGLGNHFYVGQGRGQRLIGDLDLSVAYDFRGDGEFGLAIAEGNLLPWKRVRGSFDFAWDLEETRVDQGLLDLYMPLDGILGLKPSSRIRLGYRYRREVGRFYESFDQVQGVEDVNGSFGRFKEEFTEINQVSAATRLRLTDRWAFDYRIGYSLHRTTFLTNFGAIEYTSGCHCWAIQLMAEDNRTRGFRAGINFTFLGFGMDRDEPFRSGGMFGSGMF